MKPTLREMTADDRSFILSSWLKSYRDTDFARHISNDAYYAGQARLIDDLLDTSCVIVASDPEYPTSIYGYVVYKDNILHYLYTKYPFRRNGVANLLYEVAGRPAVATHWTFVVPKLPFKLSYNPYQR